MAKVTLSPIGNPENSSFVTELNAALDILADEFDKVVYRDGSYNLTDDLDANSNRIFNLPAPVLVTEPLRLGDVGEFQGEPGADAEQPAFTYAVTTLIPGADATLDVTGTYPNLLFTFGIPRGTAGASGALSDGDMGDIVVSGSGATLTVDAKVITLGKLADFASAGVLGATAAGAPSILSFATVKSQLSLDNVNNTSDANKPVSTATQTALDLKANSTDVAPKLAAIVDINVDTTLSDATHLNKTLKLTGTTTRTITLNGTPSEGFTCIGVNRATVSFNIACAAGIYKNGATATTTTAVIAAGAQFTLLHEGLGVWSITGAGVS